MSLSFAHGAIQWLAADGATTVYTVSGLSFQPKALRFYFQGIGSATDTETQTLNARAGIGFAVSTSSRRCVAIEDQDNVGDTVCTDAQFTDCIAATVEGAGPSRDGALDLNSITSDGFTAIVDDQSPVDITVFWEAWGGSDITVAVVGDITEPAAAGDQDYTVTGFTAGATDQVVLLAGTEVTSADTVSRTTAALMSGMATGTTDAENVVLAIKSNDAVTTTVTARSGLDARCLVMFGSGSDSPDADAELTQFGTDNFRLNWFARAVTDRRYIFLAMKGGQWRVGSTTIETGTIGNTATVSGLPFSPTGILGICMGGNEAFGTGQGVFQLATATSTSSRRGMGWASADGVATSLVSLTIQYDQWIARINSGGATFYTDIDAVTSDGFTIIWDGTDTTAGTLWIGYLTFASDARRFFLLT